MNYRKFLIRNFRKSSIFNWKKVKSI